MANEYASLAELKTFLRITATADDTELQDKLTAASRRIERDTGRRFWTDVSATARTYRATHETLLLIDDVSTTTSLLVETGRGASWTTVAGTGYDALPENALADGWAIETLERVDACWPLWGSTRVRVTAKWGWPAVPDPIKAACLLLAGRLFRRKDSVEGVAAFNDMGAVRVSRYDADYDNAIAPYVRTVT